MSCRQNGAPICNQCCPCPPESGSCICMNSMMSSELCEGCPAIEESGTVCAETKTLAIINEFREIYNNCIKQMEGCGDDNGTLERLAPFKKLVEDLWEQNTMLVETVEELEREATCRVALLQEKLNQCSEKVAEKITDFQHLMNDYVEDIDSLVEVIRRFRENGKLDTCGLRFKTICDAEIYGICRTTCAEDNDCVQRSSSKSGSCKTSDDNRSININLQLVQDECEGEDDNCDCDCECDCCPCQH